MIFVGFSYFSEQVIAEPQITIRKMSHVFILSQNKEKKVIKSLWDGQKK